MCGGRTASAVIARAARLKLGPKTKAKRAPSFIPAITLRPVVHILSPEIVELPVNQIGVSLEDLEDNMCNWPVSPEYARDVSFCGEKCEGRYCAEHTKLAHQPKRRAA